MKANYYFLPILLFLFFASCSSSDDDETIVNEGGRKLRYLTITQVEADKATRSLFDLTRASLTDNGKTLSASWNENDLLTYCNLSILDRNDLSFTYHTDRPLSGTLKAESANPQSTITGQAICNNGDYLSLIYPVNTFILGPNVLENNVSHPTVQYTINISGQDGTIDKLANQYHYVFGEVTVAVKDDKATGEVNLESLLAVCRFSFKYNNEKIHIEKLTINYLSADDYGGKYPVSATLIAYPGYHNLNPVIIRSGAVLEINPPSGTSPEDVYVALLPTGSNGRTFRFVVNDTYYYEGDAILNAGEFYPTVLNLNKLNN